MPDSLTIEFSVPGIPRPGGSKTATLIRRKGGEIVMCNGRPLITTREAGVHTAAWRKTVAAYARKAYRGKPLEGPLSLTIKFVMPRPQSHYRSNGTLKSDAPKWHTCKPDRTKLMRSLEDSLTGICWIDDTQVVTGLCEKVYGSKPGATVKIEQVLPVAVQEDLFINETDKYPQSERIA